MAITVADFLQDSQGRRFRDVADDTRFHFADVVSFFGEAERQRRMDEAEIHHDRPCLAGVVREFEQQFEDFLASQDGHTTQRLRQAVGVVIRMIMEQRGWQKTGRKGSLGTRVSVKPGTSTPGAYHNSGGLARWFTRAERYEPPSEHPFRGIWERSQA
jgi:hypothetical protein